MLSSVWWKLNLEWPRKRRRKKRGAEGLAGGALLLFVALALPKLASSSIAGEWDPAGWDPAWSPSQKGQASAASTGKSPVFLDDGHSNLTVQVGETAFLSCKVENLGENTLVFVRQKDFRILTSGLKPYTSDDRFHIRHDPVENRWSLQINFVTEEDAGAYECQISTGVSTLKSVMQLNVVVPEAFILGNSDIHVNRGSTINLVCIIEKSQKPPAYLFWYHEDEVMNHDLSQSRVSVFTDPGPRTHSRLLINDARGADTGNYTCKAANAKPAHIYVFVEDDKTSAVHHKSSASCLFLSNVVLLLFGVHSSLHVT